MSQFQKGQARPAGAGRKKGSLNKKKIPKVAEYLAERDINPAKEILDLINAKDDLGKPLMSNGMKAQAWFDLLSYCQAKPKELEADEADKDDGALLDQFEQVTNDVLLSLVKNPDEAS